MIRCRLAVGAAVMALAQASAHAAPCAGFSDVDDASSFCTSVAWLKNRGITQGCAAGLYCPADAVRRDQMAAFLYRLADALTTGEIAIAADVTSWNYTNPVAPITKNIATIGRTAFQRSTVGFNYLRISPTIPRSLYGRSLGFVGVEVCYRASPSATLAEVAVYNSIQTINTTGTSIALAADVTDRTDEACRRYDLPAPVPLSHGDSGIFFRLGVDWNAAGAVFDVGRTTLYFLPTAATAPLADPPQGNVTVLRAPAGAPRSEDEAPRR